MIAALITGPDAVFDCNFYLRAVTRSSGPAFECLQLLGTTAYTSMISRDVLAEVKEVLLRPSIQQKFPALTPDVVTELLTNLAEYCVLIYNIPETFRYSRDPDDEVYINLALVTGAQYLVTYDKDLLDLMTRNNEEATSFRHRFPALKIVDPKDFLETIKAL